MSSHRLAESASTWRRQWALVTGFAALTTTLFDAALLQRSQTYFTGGFLSVDHIEYRYQAALFILGSLLADAAVCGVLCAIVLGAAGHWRVSRRLAWPAAFIAGVLPPVVSDFVAYELLRYLGEAFDIQLMFDLAGRGPSELLAVSAGHLGRFVLVGAAAVLLLGAVMWALRYHVRRGRQPVPAATWTQVAFTLGVLVATGLVVTTALRTNSTILDNGLRRKPTAGLLGSVVQRVTDVDRDGYGLLSRPADPALFDARIHPYALDVPGNGIDEDGIAGDLPTSLPPYAESAPPALPWLTKPDIVMIGLESVRADVVNQVVDGRAVTPTLNALAASGVSSAHAYSHNGYTVQSRHHMFAGSVAWLRGDRTLLDDLKAQGYQTAYFSAQDESFGGASEGIGFERVDVPYDARVNPELRFSKFSTPGSLALPYSVIVDKVKAFLTSRESQRPLFLYVNFQDTHFPYHHGGIQPLLNNVVLEQGDITPAAREALRSMYLNTVANVDRAVGTILAQVSVATGNAPGVIVLSDHGESLFDEGFLGHGYALNDAQTRVPFIVANLPLAIPEPFGQSDLRDTLANGLHSPALGGPRLVPEERRRVFQYLGNVTNPAQIGVVSAHGRIVYDFREHRVRVNEGTWQAIEQLGPEDKTAYTELVQRWERMMVARAEVH